jgi:hypothetical protein
MSNVLEPRHVHPGQWHQAIALAREVCGRYFADGRSPADAVRAHGLAPSDATGWAGAVNAVAEVLCARSASLRRVA